MNVLISGASGLIGKDLVPLLQRDGHQVLQSALAHVLKERS